MATVASIYLDLKANIANLQLGMSNAEKSIKGLEHAAESVNRTLEMIGAAWAAEKIVEHFTEITKEAFKSVDSLYHLAQATGATTEGIGGLRIAADDMGISGEEVDASLVKLNRSIGDAVNGAGNGEKAFTALGLSAQALSAMSTDQAFMTISQAIKEVESPAERARLAVEIFGKSGASLLPLLMQGREGLEDFKKEAQQMGFALNEVDVSKVHAAMMAVNNLKDAAEGLGNQIIVALSPYIEAAAKEWQHFSEAGGSATQKVANGMKVLQDVIWAASYAAQGVTIAFQFVQLGATGVLAAIVKAIDLVIAAVDKMLEALGKGPTGARAFTTQLMDNLKSEMRGTTAAISQNLNGGGWGAKIQDEMMRIQAAANASAEKMAATMTKPAAAMRDLSGDVEKSAKLVEELQAKVAGFGTAGGGVGPAVEAQKRAAMAWSDAVQAVSVGAAADWKGAQMLQDLADAASRATVQLEALDTAAKAQKGLEDMAAKLADQVANFGNKGASEVQKAAQQLQAVKDAYADLWDSGASDEVLFKAAAGVDRAQAAFDSVKKNTDALAGLEAQKKMQEEAQRIVESTQTSYEKYIAQVERVRELQAAHALSAEQASKAVQKAREEYEKTVGALGTLAEGEMVIGGRAENRGLAAIANAPVGGQDRADPKPVPLKAEKEILDLLASIKDNTARGRVAVLG